jgi:indole-3-glycerol phosphate synthase
MSAFAAALRAAPRPIVMEIKRQAGDGTDLLGGRSVAQLVAAFETGGAPCLSVVTGRWFGGSADLLREVLAHTDRPVLQKDFLVRRSQLIRAGRLGVSAVLLTARVLPRAALADLTECALELGLTPFVEVADEAEAAAVHRGEHCVVGVNNKDITDRERAAATMDRSRRLLSVVAATGTTCTVSASGITRPDDAAALLDLGYAGLLIGTGLLTAADPARWLAEFDRHRATRSRR